MYIERDLDVITNGLADSCHLLDPESYGSARPEKTGTVRVAHTPSDKLPSVIDCLPRMINERIYCVAPTDVWVTDHPVPYATTQQFENWNTECLTFDVPKSDVNSAYGRALNNTSGEEPTAEHDLPLMHSSERILTDHIGDKRSNGLGNSRILARQPGEPDTIEPLVGLNFYIQSTRRFYDKRLEGRDLHSYSCTFAQDTLFSDCPVADEVSYSG
jgi:hypothetical protein